VSFPLREYFRRLREALAGVASEETLRSLRNTVSANDYTKLTLDLSEARTNVEIATRVHSLRVLRFSPGATFALRFFAPTKDVLTQEDLPAGSEIVELEPTSIFLTNTAQAGLTLTLLVFRRV